MTAIRFSAQNVTVDPNGLIIDQWHKALVNIHADIRIEPKDGQTFFEENLCVVELLWTLRNWLRNDPLNENYFYESMDFEEREILVFTALNSYTWQISSCWQQLSHPLQLSPAQLQRAVSDFLQSTEALVDRSSTITLIDFKEYSQ